jgi:peptidoglycan/xylan/chitin deacetylase (PgdA/CDA1 family)
MTIGSHTELHVRVDKMKDAQQMHAEVAGSRDRLREKLGDEATAYFSYPFGALAPAGDSAVRAAGYRAARAYTGGPWNSGMGSRRRISVAGAACGLGTVNGGP